MPNSKFSWIPIHHQLADYLSDHRNDQPGLVQLLRDLDINALNDKDDEDQVIDLAEIDPFTFFCYLYKFGPVKSLANLQRLSERLGFSPIPTDVQGVPTANAQKVWLFPYKKLRKSNEVARLWTFFDAVRNDAVTDELFADVLSIRNVGLTKLTESLFTIQPETYLPLNRPVRPWLLSQFSIDARFETWTDYGRLLSSIRSQTDQPFAEISYNAWLARQEAPVNYWIFQGNPDAFDLTAALQQNILTSWTVTAHKDKIRPGDQVIIWATGRDAGCYALAEVTGRPGPAQPAPDDHLWKNPRRNDLAVAIRVTHDLSAAPLSWAYLKTIPDLEDLKVGNQGTNFMATEQEFTTISDVAESARKPRTWLFAPGRGASAWDEFYQKGIMAIGWDDLGDLNDFPGKDDIVRKLQQLEDTEGSKKNDASACWEFVKELRPGDSVIVKKGRTELLGHGIIKGDYRYDPARKDYHHTRAVEWKTKGSWPAPERLAIKTLTDISPYPGFPEKLMAIMTGGKLPLKKTVTPRVKTNAVNTILFGPPGTGKTYHTINRALSILQGVPVSALSKDRQALQEQFRQFQTEGRIGFVTFHPSFSYEDFVEGLKPVIDEAKGTLKYEIQPGIFKTMVVNAAYEYVKTVTTEPGRLTFESRWESFVQDVEDRLSEGTEVALQSRSNKKLHVVKVSDKGNLIIRHEGATTEQEYVVSRDRSKKLFESYPSLEAVDNINTAFRAVIGGSNTSAYWAVLKALSAKETPHLQVEPVAPLWDQKASRIEDLDWSEIDPDAPSVRPYVLIIDEINPGNIPAIFGELITLIEDDKRAGREEGLSLTLPYSKEAFQVPANLYLIGTMNTADRSVEALDAALRRRFAFEPQMPQPGLLSLDIGGVDVSAILSRMNTRLERLLDRDHTIGHAYFMGASSIDDLALVFGTKVIPQLQEYFYGDWRKIGMVLGKEFVTVEETAPTTWPAGFDDEAEEAKGQVYRIRELKTPEEWKSALLSILA